MDLTGELASAFSERISGPPNASVDPQAVLVLDGLGLGAQPTFWSRRGYRVSVSMLDSSTRHLEAGNWNVTTDSQIFLLASTAGFALAFHC